MKNYLGEGLRKSDLAGLVLPLVTIDEYQSKINDDKSIVVGFYVQEEDAAHDLSNFVEREPYMVLDTDVSPAPTKDGYYVCFAEFERTPDFPQALIKVLGDVARLCEVENWQFTTVKLPKDKILELSEETLQKHVDCESRNPKKKQHKDVMEFFRDSALTNVVLEGNTLSLLRRGILHTHEFVGLGDILPTGAVDLSESASGECFRLCNFLGGPYTVHKLGSTLVVENWNTGKFLTLR